MTRALLWWLLRPVFRCSPTPLHGIRRWILTICGARVAPTTKIRPDVRIDRPWNLRAGHLTIFGDKADLRLEEPLRVGDRCVVSQYAVLATVCVEPDQPAGVPDPGRTRRGPITIGDDCWVATDAFVMPGSTIHAGTVVGARALVDGELPGWSVAVGEPASAIKPRAFVNPAQERPRRRETPPRASSVPRTAGTPPDAGSEKSPGRSPGSGKREQ